MLTRQTLTHSPLPAENRHFDQDMEDEGEVHPREHPNIAGGNYFSSLPIVVIMANSWQLDSYMGYTLF